MKKNWFGLMQGRLLPPVNGKIQAFPEENWVSEFMLARKAHLDGIEWIYDVGEKSTNPIVRPEGVAEILWQIEKSGVKVNSLCADYFMTETLLKGSTRERSLREETLRALMGPCLKIGVRRVILPFVDSSRLSTKEESNDLIRLMREVGPWAEAHQMELHLETDLAPAPFAELIGKIGHPSVKINYDSGNSASHGYKIEEEFSAYGSQIGSVHLKDRVLRGSTVPLGTGGVDFAALREGLDKINYDSDFILQVARGTPGDELDWTRKNLQFVKDWWGQNL